MGIYGGTVVKVGCLAAYGKGALQGIAEEHGAYADAVRAVESLDGETALDGTGAPECSVRRGNSAETSLARAYDHAIDRAFQRRDRQQARDCELIRPSLAPQAGVRLHAPR